jgi:hypothetical protein
MMKKLIYIFFSVLILILISCSDKITEEKEIKENTNVDTNETKIENIKAKGAVIDNFKVTDLKSYDRVICTPYSNKTIDRSWINFAPFSKEFVLDIAPISFLSMLSDAEKTGYCCCPERNLLLMFFDKDLNSRKVFIDTISSDKVVRLYESGYQYSYLIEKTIWREFIASQTEINYCEYFIMDIDISKKVYRYLEENKLPFLTSNSTSEKWMDFEGDFKVTISTVGKKISENDIYKNLYDIYGDENYRIETIGKYQMCSSGENDCYEEYVLKIYCDKEFYDNFDTYLPKSFFDKAIGNFIVLGKKEELKKLEDLYPNEKK